VSLNATAVATDSHHVTVLQFCFTAEPQSLTLMSWNCLEGWKLPGCHCSLTGTLLTSLFPLISVYPLVQIPTPANGGILYCRTFVSSYMRMDHVVKTNPCCHLQHLKSAITPSHLKVSFHQKLCVVFRGVTMIPVVFLPTKLYRAKVQNSVLTLNHS